MHVDESAVIYLMLANHILHMLYPQCITVAEVRAYPHHSTFLFFFFHKRYNFSCSYLFPTNYSSHYLFSLAPEWKFHFILSYSPVLWWYILFKAELLRNGI